MPVTLQARKRQMVKDAIWEAATKTMEIVARYPAARAAEVSRFPDVQDRVIDAYTRRCPKKLRDEVTPKLLAGLTLQVLGVALLSWHSQPEQDVRVSADRVMETLDRLICRKNDNCEQPADRVQRRPRRR